MQFIKSFLVILRPNSKYNMSYEGNFILQKEVNWSLLNHGLAIPTSVWNLFGAWDANIMIHGTSRRIKILVEDELFDAILYNQNFSKEKFPNVKDLIQIRYTSKSAIAKKLQAIFHKSYRNLSAQRLLLDNPRKHLQLPDDIHEYIRFYFTDNPDVFRFECNTDEVYKQVADILRTMPEEMYESTCDDTFFMQDKTASILERERLVKYRKIDRNIIRALKEHYDYRDEISGEKIGLEYGECVVEAHHIDYFTVSQNNDTTNIIIISPNYHRIIHKNNPTFNRKKFQFEFPNGEILKLKLYDHLLVR